MYHHKEIMMSLSSALRRFLPLSLGLAAVAGFGAPKVADLNPAAIKVTMPDKIPWVENEKAGSAQAILVGDPAKPGLYIVLTKWHPGHMSRPHFHPNDRYITVLSGTWWVGTGSKYDPASTVGIPAGSFVVHTGKEIHYDGAKEGSGDAVLQILGMGPATSTPAETK
jgi:hypothetical protein